MGHTDSRFATFFPMDVDQCERVCASHTQCRFLFSNINGVCVLHSSCDETRSPSNQSGQDNVRTKEKSTTFFTNCLMFIPFRLFFLSRVCSKLLFLFFELYFVLFSFI